MGCCVRRKIGPLLWEGGAREDKKCQKVTFFNGSFLRNICMYSLYTWSVDGRGVGLATNQKLGTGPQEILLGRGSNIFHGELFCFCGDLR